MASNLSWFLVMEELVRTKKMDVNSVMEMLKKVPDVCDDLAKKAKELVCLRILENMYDEAIEKNGNDIPPICSQINLDPCDYCEEEPSGNYNMGGAVILKWNMRSFIMHKRSYLLKDEILLAGRESNRNEDEIIEISSDNDEDHDEKKGQKGKEEEEQVGGSEKASTSYVEKRPKKYKLRRNNINWTKREEETLKEGMKRITVELEGRRIPWTKIMNYGGSVFRDRTTVDLKDKWRNLSKKENH